MLHHRHKQRFLGGIITLIILTVAADIFIILGPIMGQEAALLFALTAATGLAVTYMTYNYRHSHEHHVLVNTLTQIYLGSVLFIAGVIILVVQAFTAIDPINAYLWFSLLTLTLTFLFHGKFDAFLHSEVHGRFPMGEVPTPKKRSRS